MTTTKQTPDNRTFFSQQDFFNLVKLTLIAQMSMDMTAANKMGESPVQVKERIAFTHTGDQHRNSQSTTQTAASCHIMDKPAVTALTHVLDALQCPPSILLIGDTMIAQKMTASLLEGLCCSVDISHSAEDALHKIDNHTYDLILTDIGLPRINGIEMTRYIRNKERQQASQNMTPIIGQSAQVNITNRKACLSAGMQDCLPKPLVEKAVASVLYQHISSYRAADSAFIETGERKIYSHKVIDYDLLQERIHDQPIIQSIFHEALKGWSCDKMELNVAFESKDWKQLLFIVHKLRGGYIYLSAMRLEAAFSHLEDYLTDYHQPNTSEVDSMYHVIVEEMQAVKKEIHAFLTRQTTEGRLR
jgi:two-component system aerobic respiration control sensor histidine kinase ArcB